MSYETKTLKEAGSKLEIQKSKIEDRPGLVPGKKAIRDFKDLEVWRAARTLRCEVYKLSLLLPDYEKFGLASQLRRAAASVTANIAEGFGRFGYQENAQMCRQARGSVYEIRDHLTTCVDQCYVRLEEAQSLDRLAQRVAQMLNGYVRSTLALKANESR